MRERTADTRSAETRPPVIIPLIHLNGDRPETLIGNLRTLYQALGVAAMALRENAPNARNYYPEPGLFQQARTQHQHRLRAIESLREDLVTELHGIEDQQWGA